MECVEAALKTSFRMETAVKASPQVLYEDIWVQNGVSCDDFFVDELLDLTHGEGFGVEESTVPEQEEVEEEKPCGATLSSPELDDKSTNFAAKDDVASSVPATELCVPADDVVSLEWVSHFVEDSNSEYCAAFPAGAVLPEPNTGRFTEPEKPKQLSVLTERCFKTPVPAKARSKRTRTSLRVWPLLGSPSITESSSSSTTTSSSSCHSSSWLIYSTKPGMNVDSNEPVSFEECQQPPKKPKKKRPAAEVAPNSGGSGQLPRRCSHCGVQKTPQWRTGPLGAKTLCNACGVRYKSGRLLPEYRPACSPTFSSELHSNHHRKVLEMRKKKETSGRSESGLAPSTVPSFG